MSKNKKRRSRYEQPVAIIQEAALNAGLSNCVSTELTYQQALSVLLRSRQLDRESNQRSLGVTPETMARQTDHCYRQRAAGKDIRTQESSE